MDRTPKLQRVASSLSLSTRLNKKRHSASPQLKAPTSDNVNNSRELNSNTEFMQRSPSVKSICSDGGIECTPPHKKMPFNLDESLDFSPKMFDSSFSPTCLLSQTLAIDSPEVGWKWSRHTDKCVDPNYGTGTRSIRTPDSAYAADSSFASASSSSTEVAGNERRGNSYKMRSLNAIRREDQRKTMEQELRRVENTRAEEMLKQRCARLQEQLKSTGTQKVKISSQSREESFKKNVAVKSKSSSSIESTTMSAIAVSNLQTSERAENAELLNDFLNDSDMDSFLLQATQEIESKIEAKAQPTHLNSASATQKSSISSESSIKPSFSTTPTAAGISPSNDMYVPLDNDISMNSGNDKRSSFYMKFLEDDCADDWFASLDEVILQATHNKKPRTSLQRYKSMPTDTAGNSKNFLINKDKNDNCVVSQKSTLSEETAASSSAISKIKRHSSTHALGPVATNYRSRRQL